MAQEDTFDLSYYLVFMMKVYDWLDFEQEKLWSECIGGYNLGILCQKSLSLFKIQFKLFKGLCLIYWEGHSKSHTSARYVNVHPDV